MEPNLYRFNKFDLTHTSLIHQHGEKSAGNIFVSVLNSKSFNKIGLVVQWWSRFFKKILPSNILCHCRFVWDSSPTSTANEAWVEYFSILLKHSHYYWWEHGFPNFPNSFHCVDPVALFWNRATTIWYQPCVLFFGTMAEEEANGGRLLV